MDSTKASTRLARRIESVLFGHRKLVIALFAIVSVFMAVSASQLRPDASFQKMIPVRHPFIVNFLEYANELRPLGNVLRIVVVNKQGSIYDKHFLEKLREINDEVFYIPGVDRGNLSSIWTPNVMWHEITEEGVKMGPIIGQGFKGTPEQIDAVKANVDKSGRIGSLVSNDQHSAIILAPLLEVDPQSGQKLDYGTLSSQIETRIRDRFSSDNIDIHVVGFAKLVGDLIHGAKAMAGFFLITFTLTVLLLLWYSRCWKSTLATVFCCSLAVIWHLGLIHIIGMGLNPYSILVPFLTFAIGVSHAIQNVRTMAVARYHGASKIEAAKATFSLLFIPGTVALLADAVGFSTLYVIDIGVIRDLAVSASVGVAVIIFTKMFLLPVMMSYSDVTPAGLRRVEQLELRPHKIAWALSALTGKKTATVVVSVAALVTLGGLGISHKLKVGDLDPGAPELRPNSRYNQDVRYLVNHYSTSSDVFVVMVKTPKGECGSYPVAAAVDEFQWRMANTPGVEGTFSLFDIMKQIISGFNGGNPKWMAITRNRFISNGAHNSIPGNLYNSDCSMLPVVLFLSDHKAETLSRVVNHVQAFADENNTPTATFLMAAGNSGIEAATNMVVERAQKVMLVLVYGIVGLLIWWEFKSIRIMLAIMLPLFITEVLCKVIMVELNLGIKVATLPVIALGVGIGVDYGIYIYNRLESHLAEGQNFREAYFNTLKSTGVAVALTAMMLALGVLIWVFSAIKFQADMGLLLTFMFVWNMIGAIVLIPALLRLIAYQTLVRKFGPSV
ncbi:efflux RND transporter permease subunit [Limnobacter litoralis]|uniref:Membrane protein n=1 Tax=Limnobacter litoralis TaxID=481366 RepID=A0ABQ5YKK6_9BURK|nr:MMPL family transporter [Limnobacter litoralis]GLR25073.1 membrane protein [Limnobacter litoralis]